MISKQNHLVSINPADAKPVGQVLLTHPKSVESVVQKARSGYLEWRSLPLNERAGIIKKTQQLMLARAEKIAQTITLEMGRPYTESLAVEMEAGIDLIGYYAKKTNRFLNDRPVPLHHIFFFRRKSLLSFHPLGVLGIITPWNWPLLIPLGGIVPALLSGNAVVFKPSELTPLVADQIRKIFIEAGVPETVFQVIQGDGRVGSALVESSVEKIFFTGSTGVGQKILEHGASSLKKVVLEMGGSDPAIVCEDVNLEVATSGILWGGFNNCGQNCNSIERIYVHKSIAEELINKLISKIKKLRIGEGMRPESDIGPLASEAQLKKMKRLVKKAKKDGGEILCGGRHLVDRDGYYFEPTLIYAKKPLPSFFNEELFGPIMMITPVANDLEAVEMANNTAFGLSASVWTKDRNRGIQIAKQIESGTVMINDVLVSFGMTEAGWTGIKNSGIGWVHGEKGLDEMVNTQYLNHDPQHSIQKLWWFPYSQKITDAMIAGLQFLFEKNWMKKIKVIPRVLKSFAGYLLFNSPRKDKW